MKGSSLLVKLKQNSSVIKFLDINFSFLIVSPLVVIYWFTAWKLSDIYLSPENLTISATISFSIGFIGQFVSMYYQCEFERVGSLVKIKFLQIMITKFYALLFALTSISFWRGMWIFADILSSNDNFELCLDIVQNSLILMLLKAFKNTLSTPFVTMTDEVDNCFNVDTYFNKKVYFCVAKKSINQGNQLHL